jgi:hypothetical protein
MIPLPRWAWPFLLDKLCPHCGHMTKLENVEGVGIRQKKLSKKIVKGNAYLTFEYYCTSCKKKSSWEADPDDANVSAEDLSINILETIEVFMGRRPGFNRNKVSTSKISNKEFQAFKKRLDKFESHEDFLNYIGIPQEQIEKFKKDVKKDGEQNK